MIAVDTNIALRYLLGDDDTQAALSRRLFEGSESVLITDVVLAETLWTLAGRKYKATKADLISVVDKFLQEPNVCFEDDDVIWLALEAYRNSDADFADALILHKALKLGSMRDRMDKFYTFDISALQLPYAVRPK